MIGFPILLDRLEQHQRITTAIAQLVLRQIRGDRVNPGRKLLGLIEAMQVAENANEHLLYEVFGALPVTDGAIHEVQQARLVTVDTGTERLRFSSQMPHHHLAVIELVQRLALMRALLIDGGCGAFQRGPHRYPMVSNRNREHSALTDFSLCGHESCLPGLRSKPIQLRYLRVAADCE